MLYYVAEALICFQPNTSIKLQDQPKYGEKVQHAKEKYYYPLLENDGKSSSNRSQAPSSITHRQLIEKYQHHKDP